jgi:chemotaxis response regulator CheB
MSKNNSDCSYVVGVGASAGGLEALEAFFANLPTNTGASFLVIQHLSPDFESVMDQLLRRHTHMPVVMAADGMALSPDKVFLIPPKTQLTLHGEALRVRPQERDRHPRSRSTPASTPSPPNTAIEPSASCSAARARTAASAFARSRAPAA